MAGEKVYKALRSRSRDGSDQGYEPKTGGDGIRAHSPVSLNVTDAENVDLTCSRTFRPRKQLWTMLGGQMSRLIFTVVLVAFLLITLRMYKNKGTVAHTDKIVFNTIITCLNLALGLNFLVHLRSLIKGDFIILLTVT